MALQHDGMTKALHKQITEGIQQINEANKVLLATDDGTPTKDIDKVLKDENADVPEEIRVAWKTAQEALVVYKTNAELARNSYRVDVLGEEPKQEQDEAALKEELKEVRTVVTNALTFLKSYATQNKMDDIVEWVGTVAVPHPGRQGASVTGVKKPRVNVRVDGALHGSFGEAAAALSDKDNKFTAGNLAEAWKEAGGEEGEFTFSIGEVEHTLEVTSKPKTK